MPQSDKRVQELAGMQRCLNTSDGELLMAELKEVWDQFKLLGADSEVTAYNVGLRDAYKFLRMLADGDLSNE